MVKLMCDGFCGEFGGCYGDVRKVVVSRMGEMNLCGAAAAAYEVGGYVVSNVYDVNSESTITEDILNNQWVEITTISDNQRVFLCVRTGKRRYEVRYMGDDNRRGEIDVDVLRQLGHFLVEDKS